MYFELADFVDFFTEFRVKRKSYDIEPGQVASKWNIFSIKGYAYKKSEKQRITDMKSGKEWLSDLNFKAYQCDIRKDDLITINCRDYQVHSIFERLHGDFIEIELKEVVSNEL